MTAAAGRASGPRSRRATSRCSSTACWRSRRRRCSPTGEGAEALVDPVAVTLVEKAGASQSYELGADSDELFAFRAGERRALVRGTLHRELVELLEAE